ncbi:MAG: universal stress protein [Leptolyngbyaceae cyanobacterium RM2_2_4]|nr:universal stress protein [Leptolyngbyaceae cyanobacterium RM2_2_4]
MFQRIIVCTDFSDGVYRLANCVPSLAAGGAKQIIFLHVVSLSDEREIPRPDEKKMQAARDRLSVALENVPDGVDVRVVVESGKPSDHIFNAAKTHNADLIILGMPSRNLLAEKLFGSTTMNLCQRMAIPVMTLRPQLVSTYTVEELNLRCRHLFRYLLLPYDGSAPSQYLVQQVKQFAQQPDSSLECCMLFWVVDPSGRSGAVLKESRAKEAESKLIEVKADLAKLGLRVETEVRLGDPVPEVLKAAEVYDISAIATSSGSLGKLIEWSVPSFTGEILRRSWHPVIYFPPTRG